MTKSWAHQLVLDVAFGEAERKWAFKHKSCFFSENKMQCLKILMINNGDSFKKVNKSEKNHSKNWCFLKYFVALFAGLQSRGSLVRSQCCLGGRAGAIAWKNVWTPVLRSHQLHILKQTFPKEMKPLNQSAQFSILKVGACIHSAHEAILWFLLQVL